MFPLHKIVQEIVAYLFAMYSTVEGINDQNVFFSSKIKLVQLM